MTHSLQKLVSSRSLFLIDDLQLLNDERRTEAFGFVLSMGYYLTEHYDCIIQEMKRIYIIAMCDIYI